MAFPGVETFVDNKIGVIEFYDLQLAVTRLCFDDGIKRILILGDSITDGVELFRIESDNSSCLQAGPLRQNTFFSCREKSRQCFVKSSSHARFSLSRTLRYSPFLSRQVKSEPGIQRTTEKVSGSASSCSPLIMIFVCVRASVSQGQMGQEGRD